MVWINGGGGVAINKCPTQYRLEGTIHVINSANIQGTH